MSGSFNESNVRVRRNGIISTIADSQDGAHVDLATMAQALTTLQSKVSVLETRDNQMDELLQKLDILSKENEAQRKYIAQLESQLQKKILLPPAGPETAGAHVTMSEAASSSTATAVPSAAPANTWTTVAKRAQRKQVTLSPELLARRQAAAARIFQPVSGPQGFEYVYFPRGRKASPAELRKKLRLLGIDPRRVLDICFPAKAVVGILVHLQYKEELVSSLGKAKIQPLSGFDPLDPAHLGDPKFASAPEESRGLEMARIHAGHCEAALRYLRFPVAVAVSRVFLEQGWVSDEAVSEILKAKPDAPRRRHHDADFDDDMSISSGSISLGL
jgi:hypothetical protein